MPTGFTAGIYEDKDVNFKDFALECARAFGALAHLRDTPNAELPQEITISSFYPEKIAEFEQELQELQKMTDEQVSVKVQKDYANDKARITEQLERIAVLKQRYESMLSEAENWTPPSEEHQALKDFMLDQLTESITHDCSTHYYDKELQNLRVKSIKEYRADKEQELQKDLAFYNDRYVEEVERVDSKNKWLKSLYRSLDQA